MSDTCNNGCSDSSVAVLPELEIGPEYYWKRTDGWKWPTSMSGWSDKKTWVDRWWDVFIEILGFNGVGGYWLIERWRWNSSLENILTDIRSLSWEESLKLQKEVIAANPTAFHPHTTNPGEQYATRHNEI